MRDKIFASGSLSLIMIGSGYLIARQMMVTFQEFAQ